MAITDELREYVYGRKGMGVSPLMCGTFAAIADRIDSAHEREVADTRNDALFRANEKDMGELGWVRLPKDADGEVIRIGDLVDEMLPFGGYAKPAHVDTMELYRSANGYGWMVKLDAENRALISPKLLRHHKQPTVEDVLREFALACEDAGNAGPEVARIAAEFASKLRLAGDDE